MRKNLGNILTGLFFFFWFACLTSQSLMDLADFLMLVTGITLLVKNAKKSGNWKLLWPNSTGLGWLWLVWIIVVAIGLFMNNPVDNDTLTALGEFRWMISFQILCFTLSLIDWNDGRIKGFILIFLLMSIVSAIMFPLNYAQDFRAGGPFNHSMPFAHSYGPAFVLCAGLMLILIQYKSPQRWLALGTTITSGIITAMSMTRGIWIGMIAGTGIISLYRSRRYGVILTSWLIVVFALLIAFVPAARERAFGDTTSMANSDNQRVALLRANFEIVKDFPLFGSGYSQNKKLLKSYFQKLGYPETQFESHAHNQYLHYWAGTGTLGLLCFLIFIGTTLSKTVLAYRKLDPNQTLLRGLSLGSLGGQICFLVGSLTESNFSIAKNRFMFLIIAAIGVSIYYRYIQKEDFKNYQDITAGS